VEKGKRAGGVAGKMPFFLPWLVCRTERGVEAARVGRPVAIAGEPGHGGGQDVGQNDEGAKGNRFPYLPWAVVARGGGFPGRRRTGGGVLGGGGAPVFREEEAQLVAVRGEAENAAVPFIAAGKAVTRSAPCSRATCGRQWWRRRFRKDPAWTRPAGFEAEK
jgi:hypothetical protein